MPLVQHRNLHRPTNYLRRFQAARHWNPDSRQRPPPVQAEWRHNAEPACSMGIHPRIAFPAAVRIGRGSRQPAHKRLLCIGRIHISCPNLEKAVSLSRFPGLFIRRPYCRYGKSVEHCTSSRPIRTPPPHRLPNVLRFYIFCPAESIFQIRHAGNTAFAPSTA